MLAGGAISWKSSKQFLVASSTMEDEIVACYETGAHDKWLRNFISGLKIVKSICRTLKLSLITLVLFLLLRVPRILVEQST